MRSTVLAGHPRLAERAGKSSGASAGTRITCAREPSSRRATPPPTPSRSSSRTQTPSGPLPRVLGAGVRFQVGTQSQAPGSAERTGAALRPSGARAPSRLDPEAGPLEGRLGGGRGGALVRSRSWPSRSSARRARGGPGLRAGRRRQAAGRSGCASRGRLAARTRYRRRPRPGAAAPSREPEPGPTSRRTRAGFFQNATPSAKRTAPVRWRAQ